MKGIRYSAVTHVGNVREVNEDAILALPDQQVWVVSDGMGGHEGGDYASQTITEALASLPDTLGPTDLMHAIRDAIQRANTAIRREAAARANTVMGATVVVLLITDGHFVAFWAGDSRLYRLRGGRIELLSSDHSVVAEYVEAGQLSWDEAEHHPNSNIITRAVGVDDTLELDKVRGDVCPGDRFLLCSDGLTKYATFAILERVLANTPIETVADRLVQIALDGGGADNVSVIVVDTP